MKINALLIVGTATLLLAGVVNAYPAQYYGQTVTAAGTDSNGTVFIGLKDGPNPGNCPEPYYSFLVSEGVNNNKSLAVATTAISLKRPVDIVIESSGCSGGMAIMKWIIMK